MLMRLIDDLFAGLPWYEKIKSVVSLLIVIVLIPIGALICFFLYKISNAIDHHPTAMERHPTAEKAPVAAESVSTSPTPSKGHVKAEWLARKVSEYRSR